MKLGSSDAKTDLFDICLWWWSYGLINLMDNSAVLWANYWWLCLHY